MLAVFDLLIAQDGFGGFHGLGIVDRQRRPGSNKSLGERNCRTIPYIVGEGFERQTLDSDLAVTQLVTEVVLYVIEHDFSSGRIIFCNHRVDSLQDVTETRSRKRYGLDYGEVERLIWTDHKDSRFYK